MFRIKKKASGIVWLGAGLLAGCANLQMSLVPEGTPYFTLEEVHGRVLVIRDPAYFVASSDSELSVGDRIVTMDKAEALLQFTQTDEQGEPIGEACQLRLPAEAHITLQGYRDCLDEDSIVLNNIAPQPTASDDVEESTAAEPVVPVVNDSDGEQPQTEQTAKPIPEVSSALGSVLVSFA